MNLTHQQQQMHHSHHHYPQQLPSNSNRTTAFAIQEILGLTPTDLAAARAYADHQAYSAYLSRSSLFSSPYHSHHHHPPPTAAGSFINPDVVAHPHANFLQQFSPSHSHQTSATLDSLAENLGKSCLNNTRRIRRFARSVQPKKTIIEPLER